MFGENIVRGRTTIGAADENQSSLLEKKNGKMQTRNSFRELTLNAFKSEIFPLKPPQGKGLKILTPE